MTTETAKRYFFKWPLIIGLTILGLILGVVDRAWGESFGNTNSTGAGDQYGYAKSLTAINHCLVPESNIIIDSLCVKGRRVAAPDKTIDLAVYKRRNGIPTDQIGKRLVTLTSDNAAWHAVACTISVTALDTICLAFGNQSSSSLARHVARDTTGVYGGDGMADTTMTDPWVHNFNSYKLPCIYAVYHIDESSPTVTTYTARKTTGLRK